MRHAAALLFLLTSLPAFAADPVLTVPPTAAGKSGAINEIRATTEGKVVKWFSPTPGLDTRELEAGKLLLFTGPKGVYTLYAYTAVGESPSDPAKCVVTIDGATPPGPPGPPDPPAPAPDDPIRAAVLAALAADPASPADKKKQCLDLAELYRQATRLANDQSISTPGELASALQQASAAMMNDPAPTPDNPSPRKRLLDVRRVTGVELAKLFPGNDPITAAQRAAAAALFTKLAAVLDAAGR